ncbi:MAG TPA: hypothetical protein PLO37_13445 [Candidatus Hydrogenedentes bacterium]|nr:hypothetical protein [Candidatus Hydrogenedentota bacterium]HPG67848.1 hypothetical protein [Candidatus Hydrogenedentota bacterium]
MFVHNVVRLAAPLCLAAVIAVAASPEDELLQELRARPFGIVCESYRDGNWELIAMNADGSEAVNLTNTPDVDELYPHASPDGKRVVFLEDRTENGARVRDVGLMSIGSRERCVIAENGRQPFWHPNGRVVAYATQSGARYPKDPYVNNDLFFYDVETRAVSRCPREGISGLLNPCFSPDGQWIVVSAVRGMGFNKSIIAFEVNGTRTGELIRSLGDAEDVYQCRPDISADGQRVAWGTTNTRHKDHMWVEIADLDLDADPPRIDSRRRIVEVGFPLQTYHVDWSPDDQYIVYAQGDLGSRMQPAPPVIGNIAKGWDLWVVRVDQPNVVVQITHDGLSNKEPDWMRR